MRIQFIINASYESPAAFYEYANSRNFNTKICYANKEAMPNVEHYDLLIVLGGPQSPLELGKYPYLANVIELIQATIFSNKKVIGVCLGAQLLAMAVGGSVAKSPAKEVGWFPINLTQKGLNDLNLVGFPGEFEVMHWHYDMPVLNDEFNLLATSQGCPTQIFSYRDLAYGFQCHLEFTKKMTYSLIQNCPNDLNSSPFTQPKNDILSGNFEALNNTLYTFLDQFLNGSHG